jgi:hypothetical protein
MAGVALTCQSACSRGLVKKANSTEAVGDLSSQLHTTQWTRGKIRDRIHIVYWRFEKRLSWILQSVMMMEDTESVIFSCYTAVLLTVSNVKRSCKYGFNGPVYVADLALCS